eukprot:501819_1
MEQKFKHKKSLQKTELVDKLQNLIQDDIEQKYSWINNSAFTGNDLTDDIVVTNNDNEYYAPIFKYQTGEKRGILDMFEGTQHSLSVEHLKILPVLYDVWLYCNICETTRFNIKGLDAYLRVREEWSTYNDMLPAMTVKPKSWIEDTVLDYHLCICAVSHVLRNLDAFAPFQVHTVIISNKLTTFVDDASARCKQIIQIKQILNQNNIKFVQQKLKLHSICETMNDIATAFWSYTKEKIVKNHRWVWLFDMQQYDNITTDIILYIYQNKSAVFHSSNEDQTINLNTFQFNIATVIPEISNDHPKLFTVNTYYINCNFVRAYFIRHGEILRFFPEHMESIWLKHFCISDSEVTSLVNEHKYKHSFGLQLPDPMFCKIYYSVTRRRFLSTHYYRKYHRETVSDLSLRKIKFDNSKLKDDDKKNYFLRKFNELTEEKEFTCIDSKTQMECIAMDRLAFMLERLIEDEMDLLAYVLQACDIKNKYSLTQFYEDIDHIEKKHFTNRCRTQEYIWRKHAKMLPFCVNLACGSLRRHTRSDRNHFPIVTAIKANHINSAITKAQQEINAPFVVVLKKLDKLHCDIFHADQNGKRMNFRRIYIDYQNYNDKSIDYLIDYVKETVFDKDQAIDDDIKNKIILLFKEFNIKPEILCQAP